MHTLLPLTTAKPQLPYIGRWQQLATAATPNWREFIGRTLAFVETRTQKQHRLIQECQAIARTEALADDGNFHPDCSL